MRSSTLMTLAAGATALAFATPAFAQSTDKPFDGFHVGVSLGYDFQPSDDNATILFDKNLDGTFGDPVVTAAAANAFSPGFCGGAATTNAPAGGCRDDKDGINYAVRFGYDKQFEGDFVVGLIGEIGKSEVRDSVSAFSTTPASYTFTREVDFDANLRLRLGYAPGNTLFYATGGPAYARVDSSFQTTNTANSFTGRGSDDAWGYVVGGGVEHMFGEHFAIGVEYLYNSYKDDDYRIRAGAGTAPATNPFILAPNTTGTDFRRSDDKFTWHAIRATASFRF